MSNAPTDAEIDRSQSLLETILEAPTPAEVTDQPPAPSPFLPGTKLQFAWDSTSLGLLKTCPRLYQYIMLEGWSRKGESVHLRFGIEFHQALQEYDVSRVNGVSHEDSIHDVVSALMERTADWVMDLDSKASRYKNRITLCGLVVDYLDHYGGMDPAETYIKANGAPAVELSFQLQLDWGPDADQPYILCGHLDRVVTFNGEIMGMDRKTTKTTIGPYYFAQYEPNNQMTLYTLAYRVIFGSVIKGIIIDATQVLLEEPNRFARGFTYRTQDQLDEWLQDLSYWLRQAEFYAESNHWPQNDTACDKFGGCQFRDICSKSPSVRQNFLRADFIQKPESERWNPLKPR